MGEIAEDIRHGKQCSLCGICFFEPHEQEVVCTDCWAHLSKKEKASGMYVKSTNEEM